MKRKTVVRVVVYGLLSLVILPPLIGTAIGTARHLRFRNEILGFLNSAQELRLEEYDDGEVTKSVVLSAAQIAEVTACFSLRGAVDENFGFQPSCFTPHHRILAKTASGIEPLLVCFGCNELARSWESPLVTLTSDWRKSLHDLFQRHGVPVRHDYRTMMVRDVVYPAAGASPNPPEASPAPPSPQ